MTLHHAQTQRLVRRRRTLELVTLACTALVACSCRSVPRNARVPQPPSEATLIRRTGSDGTDGGARVEQHHADFPVKAASHVAQPHPHVPAECVIDRGVPLPMCNVSPWAPPGLAGPWPRDEYLCDGGDSQVQVNVGRDEQLRGLELEDTVAVYETIDGETKIEPSNRVCLYAPRFAAVRQVRGVVQNEQAHQPIGVERPVVPGSYQDDQLATTAIQPEQPVGQIGRKQPNVERVGEYAVAAETLQPIAALEGGFAPHEDFLIMRQGLLRDSERAQVAEAVDAAITWTHDEAVQVVLDGKQAVSISGEQKAQATFRVDVPNHPCLRVIKVASTKVAKPGDIVDFTIRFDNLGDQAINKVVLIDNLTTRLEYVAGSAQSSRPAEFFTEENQGDSLLLKWEFEEPLPAGQGGLVRFHCRVR
jgi:uncharacterized repeat protein (TIGR01451 family)